MSDTYLDFANSKYGKVLCNTLGLPVPPVLRRADKDQPQEVDGSFLLGAAAGSQPMSGIQKAFRSGKDKVSWYSVPVYENTQLLSNEQVHTMRLDGLVYDASTISSGPQLEELYEFFHHTVRNLRPHGRVLVVARSPRDLSDPVAAGVQRGLTGFVKSLAREIGRKGATANIIYVDQGADSLVASGVRFFLSRRSAFVSGQQLQVSLPKLLPEKFSWEKPLQGKVALVTGAAQGIGAEIARILSRDGATVVGLDIPQSAKALDFSMRRAQGKALKMDICDPDGVKKICDFFRRLEGIDILVHNAGITRDKTLGKMDISQWQQVLDINFNAIERVTKGLLKQKIIRKNGRVIMVSSVSGIAGNLGQTNYATTKAGVIGLTEAFDDKLGPYGITVNSVAPGFIETEMTARIPALTRQFGRRLSSLSQGGLPVDVAEAIAFLAAPQSQGLRANTLRVCGHSLMGA